MTPEEKVALLKDAGVWDVIGFPGCIDKLFDLVAKHERNRHAWTQEHWTEYEHAIAAAERKKFMAVCEAEYKKYDELITEEDVGHEEATAIIHLMRKLGAMK